MNQLYVVYVLIATHRRCTCAAMYVSQKLRCSQNAATARKVVLICYPTSKVTNNNCVTNTNRSTLECHDPIPIADLDPSIVTDCRTFWPCRPSSTAYNNGLLLIDSATYTHAHQDPFASCHNVAMSLYNIMLTVVVSHRQTTFLL